MKVGAAEFEKPKEFGDAILVRAAKMIAGGEEQANLGEIGGFPLTISNLGVVYEGENGKEHGFVIEIGAQHPEEVKIGDPKVADATGVAMKLLNTVRKMPERVAKAEQTIETTKTNVEKLRALVQPWGDQDKLEAAEQRHRDVINQLRPKKKDDAPRLINRADAEIAENGGRFNVVNKDGQRFGEQPADGFHTKAAAEDWITDQVEKNGRRESIPADKLRHWQNHVQRIMAGTATAEYDVLSKPSPALASAGVKGRIVLNPIVAKAINSKHPDLPRSVWNDLPNLLSDPLFIMPHRSGNRDVVLVARAAKNEPVLVGIKVGGRVSTISTITPEHDHEGKKGWERLSTKLRNFLARGESIYARTKDALDRTLMLTGDNSRAIRPYGTELPGQGRIGNVTTQADLVKAGGTELVGAGRPTDGMSPDQVRAVLDNTTLAEPIGKLIDAGKIVIEPTADSDANAYVTDADGVIHLVAPNLRSDGDVTASLLHEAFHSGVRPLGDKAWSDLLGRLNSLYNQARRSVGGARAVYDKALARMAHAQETSGPYSAELTPEEFGAYVISEHETTPRAFGDWAREVIGAVKAWALRRFGRQIGAVTPDQLRSLAMAAIRDQVAGTAPREDMVASRRESVAAPVEAAKADRAMPRTVEELSDAVKALSEDQRDKALALLPLNVLPDWAAPNQVAVQQYIDTKRRMDTYRNKKQTAADEIVQRWRKAVGKGGAVAKDLADVMHQATLLGFDPARPSEGWEIEPEKAALMRRYKALTPNARAVYQEVRDAYKREADERDQVILENVSKAMDQELRAAERTRDKDLARIRDEGLTGEEKKEAVKAVTRRPTWPSELSTPFLVALDIIRAGVGSRPAPIVTPLRRSFLNFL